MITMNNPQTESGSPQNSQSLWAVDKALKILLDAVKPLSTTQDVGLDETLGKVLAQNVGANINVPEFDNSAVDGYALNLKPVQINATEILQFEITDRIPAGSTGNKLEVGCAARIFTGAPTPKGANAVIMQELCELAKDGKTLETSKPISINENIRPMGNDIQKATVILQSGKQLQAQDIALAASVGVSELKVFTKIKVGVFFTGNELVEPTKTLKMGQIFNSNRYALVALLNQLGCVVVNLGNVKDDLNATTQALTKLADECDLILTTGGVSVGDEDHIKPAVQALGELSLWRINMKPGKPLAFGRVGQTAFIGLPGNPVSAMVTFFLFARPFIKKMQGRCDYQNQIIKVACNFDWHQPNPRCEFVRVQLDYATTPAKANLYPKQGSDVLSSMVWADGLVEIPENAVFAKGEILNYYALL